MLTREEILSTYTVDSNGFIRNPGKFESEMLYAPYFYDALNDGGGDISESDDGDISVRCAVMDEDRALFPELGNAVAVVLRETNDGFVICVTEDPCPKPIPPATIKQLKSLATDILHYSNMNQPDMVTESVRAFLAVCAHDGIGVDQFSNLVQPE